MKNKLRLILVPLVIACFFLAGFLSVSVGETVSEKAIQMSGSGWSLSVDKAPLTVDVKSVVSVAASKDVSGAQELSLVLNSLDECKSGVVQFKVNTVGLSCFKQLPLTEEEVKQGVVRPVNVVNSYACFDGSGRKVLHIYASRLIDAKNNSVWVDQNLTAGVLTVYLNATWLSGAVFPVVLDPAFGYTSIGGSVVAAAADYIYYYNASLTVKSTATGIYLYCNTDSGSTNVQTGIYNMSDLSYVCNSVTVNVNTTLAWRYFAFSSSQLLNVGNYALGLLSDNGVNFYRDYVGNTVGGWGETTYPIWIANIDGVTHNQNAFSEYVEYAAYVVPSASPTVSPVPTSGFGFDMNWLVFAFVVFGAVLCIIPAKIFLVRVVVGLFGIILAVSQLQNTSLWFYPWSLVLWLFMSVCVVYSIWARTD